MIYRFLVVVAPHFVAGIEIGGETAPIIKYMHNWSEEQIAEYCNHKGWKIIDATYIDPRC